MNQVLTLLSEDFASPDCNCDLQELIESSVSELEFLTLTRQEHKQYKQALNRLIDEYNERRNYKIYNHV